MPNHTFKKPLGSAFAITSLRRLQGNCSRVLLVLLCYHCEVGHDHDQQAVGENLTGFGVTSLSQSHSPSVNGIPDTHDLVNTGICDRKNEWCGDNAIRDVSIQRRFKPMSFTPSTSSVTPT